MEANHHLRRVAELIQRHPDVWDNPDRTRMIQEVVDNKEAIVSANGALATWTPIESSGRRPMDTYMVRHPQSEDTIDWTSPNNIPMEADTFDMLADDILSTLRAKRRLYVVDRVLGADSAWALPTRVVTCWAASALFSDNMFRPVPPDVNESVFADRPYTLLVAPYDQLDPDRYAGRLRRMPDGTTADVAVAMDYDRRIGIVYGSAYGGSVKKTMFTVMNYYLPAAGVLPIHCSANEGPEGDCALLLGLSGTGKTTLSSDPARALLGDDEHGWSDGGIANFEFGCYAKLINLRQAKEPEIWNAVFHKDDYREHGAIVENCMMYPWGQFDVDDERYTPNSRASYPLDFLTNVKADSRSGHPRNILFLTADANGVLPPVARLSSEQAMLWFLMGYTSKLAGTETGIIEPVSTFSRFFGSPFMPRNPDVYARMLGERMGRHGSDVFLINTGWSGGPYGMGERMDINLTRSIVDAALSGKLRDAEYVLDPIFHIWIPKGCPGVPAEILFPQNTWPDPDAYETRARKLAADFSGHWDRTYAAQGLDPAIAAACPGK